MKKKFQLWATIRDVRDGDTMSAWVDQGIGEWNHGLAKSGMGLRLYGCNAIEHDEPGGAEARDNLAGLIPVGTELPIVCEAWDKWQGRIDVSILLPDIGDLVQHLWMEGWVAAPYYGFGTKPVPAWPRVVRT